MRKTAKRKNRATGFIMKNDNELAALKKEIRRLRAEVKHLKSSTDKQAVNIKEMVVPKDMKSIFHKVSKKVSQYHQSISIDPNQSRIEISGQRYVLVRASALSIEFLEGIMNCYKDRGEEEAMIIGKNILFDMSHLIGVEDASNFQELMQLNNQNLMAAGPIHFAHMGWAQVEIKSDSRLSPDNDFHLHFSHLRSFEADSWIASGKKAAEPVCIMSSGYSSGWCEKSFGIKLTAVEIKCRAKGDKECEFIMAPPNRIQKYLSKNKSVSKSSIIAPQFMQRKAMEEKLANSLLQKELLLKEIHHRVKNNLQIVSSLLNLQLDTIADNSIREKLSESISRIKSMAVLHDLLYRSENFSEIPVSKFFPSLIASISHSYLLNQDIKIKHDIKLKEDKINIDTAIPCGLIINEIISNSLKYAFENKKSGQIRLSFKDLPESSRFKFSLTISDNGTGFTILAKENGDFNLGLMLINSLVKQLGGVIRIDASRGAKYMIEF
jgi:two-component sensor histidine kinase/predicted hydrocarbon binding protein